MEDKSEKAIRYKPITAKNVPSKADREGLERKMKYDKNGTSATDKPVKNPDFPEEV